MITYGNFSVPKSILAGYGFLTEWTVSGDAAARTITLPLINTRAEGALSYNCRVIWGDGSADSTITSYDDANRIHTYAANGTYQVNIIGTCEGWSFNNAGDKLKITKILQWGTSGIFNGFKYLAKGFFGCNSLTDIASGKILASGTGIASEGFANTFKDCYIGAIPAGIFDNHPLAGTFQGCFCCSTSSQSNVALTTIPSDLFKYNIIVGTDGFYQTFFGNRGITAVPVDLFRYNVLVSGGGFDQTFRGCIELVTIPTDLFRYNVLVSGFAFYDCFQTCTKLAAIPVDLFRYNVLAGEAAFEGTFINCNALTSIPADLFRYNTEVSRNGFEETFSGCINITSVPDYLFKYNRKVDIAGFSLTFKDCNKLQLSPWIFYADGEQATRFLDNITNLISCFQRDAFTGIQGTAPDLWNCTFVREMAIDVIPATPWVPGDIITGQTSGQTCEIVRQIDNFTYLVKNVSGAYTLGEVIGVTGNASKLADQGPANPTFSNYPGTTSCFGGAGNSLTSISNYADIPAAWK
jgi:hypothetical protein